MGLTAREPKKYASVGADGTIRVKTSESDPIAVRRDYELRDGTKGTKWERVYNELSGMITDISFQDGEFGKTLQVTVSDDEKVILTLNLASNYAEDLMKKLPNIDYFKEVVFKPYSFEDKKKKLRKGISVYQNDVKIVSYFVDADGKPANGFPAPEEGKSYDSDDWKMYFIQARKFLQQFTEENIIDLVFAANVERTARGEEPKEPKEHKEPTDDGKIDVDEIPFV